MATFSPSPDHPEIQFLQALGYTTGRPYGPPIWIVVHDMEAYETGDRAESTAIYFQSPPDDRNVSSHYCVDNNSVVQCVLLKDSAWTVGNKPGNYLGINWEFAGFAAQNRDQWLDAFGLAMFHTAAPIIRKDMATFSIPLHRLSITELQDGLPGITSHSDLRLAFGGTTHTDPGANFPWDMFFSILREEPVQILVDDGTGQVWLCDGQFRRRVKSEWLGTANPPTGPITNAQVHQATILGNLKTGSSAQDSNWIRGGTIYRSGGDMDVWGIEIEALQDPGGNGLLTPHTHSVSIGVTGSGSGTSGPVIPS